jgi:hypothetical protein
MPKAGGRVFPLGGGELVAQGLQSCKQMALSWPVPVLLIVRIDAGFLSFGLPNK